MEKVIETGIAKTEAWSIDGKVFPKIDDAKSYLFEKQITNWFDEQFPNIGKRGPRPHAAVLDKLIEDRYRLLTLFKILNGGAQVALPPTRVTEPSRPQNRST